MSGSGRCSERVSLKRWVGGIVQMHKIYESRGNAINAMAMMFQESLRLYKPRNHL